MSKQPLITHVLWGLPLAGAERMVTDLCARLPSRGYRTRVLAAGGGGAMEQELIAQGVSYAIGPATKDRRQTVRFLREQFKQDAPDLLHTHLGGDIWGGLVAWWDVLHPWVITAHNMDQDDGWLLHQARRLAFQHADQVVCISEGVETYVKQEFKVSATQISRISNGIDLKKCLPRGGHGFQDIPHLVTVGRLSRQKNQAVLLRALARIKRPWRLSILGEGPEEKPLQRLAASLGILPRVQFLGTVPDARAFLQQADVFCFPSRWEGQSLALLEAAACGVPIIASELAVFHEMFDADTILYADVDHEAAWAEMIEQVIAQPTLALQRARRAELLVHERFSVERMVESYASLYKRLLRSKAQPR